MKILTITDGITNGKGGNDLITFDYHAYIYETKIEENIFYIKNNIFNLKHINTIIFNFNEDLFTYNHNWDKELKKKFKTVTAMINLFKDISKHIQKYHSKIIIYQDPLKCFELGNKITVYNKLININDDIFKIPKYKKISNTNDLNNINFFPVIIKITNGSHSLDDTICKTNDELVKVYNEKFKNNNNVFVVEYINSYVKDLECNHCLRFMVINNKIIDYYFRISQKWNIHTNDQTANKIKEADIYFKKIYDKKIINNYLNKIYKIFGNGFFAYDLIYNNGKYYICEIGLKIFDDTYYSFIKSNKINLNKLSLDKNNLKKKLHKEVLYIINN